MLTLSFQKASATPSVPLLSLACESRCEPSAACCYVGRIEFSFGRNCIYSMALFSIARFILTCNSEN